MSTWTEIADAELMALAAQRDSTWAADRSKAALAQKELDRRADASEAPITQPLYRVVVTIQAPFNDPVEIPYCQATTDRCTALAALTSAFDLHSRPDGYTFLVGVRIDVTNQEIKR